MSLKRRACGKDFEPTSTKPRKKRKRLTLSGWLNFFKIHFGLFQKSYSYKRHKVISAQQHPHTVIWCMKSKTQQIGFFWCGGEGEVNVPLWEASRPSLSRDLACGHPPAQQTPSPEHSSQDRSAKLSKEKRFRVATCKWRIGRDIGTGYVPIDPWQCRVWRIYKHRQPRCGVLTTTSCLFI